MGTRRSLGPSVLMGPHDELLTPDDVCAVLRLSKKAVYALVERRAIPHIRVSNRLRFAKTDVLRWLEKNRVPALED